MTSNMNNNDKGVWMPPNLFGGGADGAHSTVSPMKQELNHLREKAYRYRKLMNDALSDIKIVPDESSHQRLVAEDYLLMAESYYKDGVHFLEGCDLVNALVCFSYGHAFIDAGLRLGVFSVRGDNELHCNT